MTEQSHTPYDWLRQVSAELLSINEIPLIGNNSPAFPWQQFTEGLAASFHLEALELRPSIVQLCTPEEIRKSFFGQFICYKLALSPDAGAVYWLMSEQDVATLISYLLLHRSAPTELPQGAIMQGFYTGVILEALTKFSECDFDPELSMQALGVSEPPSEVSVCVDVAISIPEIKLTGRFIIPDQTRVFWKNKYNMSAFDVLVSGKRSERIMIPITLDVGHVKMPLADWENVACGDYLLLDECTLQAEDINKGRLQINAFNIPFFRAKIKDGEIKILEHPLTEQLETQMATKDQDDELEDSEFDDSDFDSEDFDNDSDFDEESEIDEDFEDSEFDDGDEESDFSELEDEESTFSEHEDDELEEHPRGSIAEQSASKSHSQTSEKMPFSSSTVENKKIAKAKDIPMTISVEVGRMQISLQNLLEIQPGNLLDINVRPEDGVSLVANGKCIAKGELLRIGETLGVRVLEIA